MKKLAFLLAALMILTSAVTVPVYAEGDMVVLRGTPTVDGVVDGLYEDSFSCSLFNYDITAESWGNGASNSVMQATCHALWDDENMYFTFRVADTSIHSYSLSQAYGDNRHAGDPSGIDGVKMDFFMPNGSDILIIADAYGNFIWSSSNASTYIDVAKLKSKTVVDASGTFYTIEIAVPFRNLSSIGSIGWHYCVKNTDASSANGGYGSMGGLEGGIYSGHTFALSNVAAVAPEPPAPSFGITVQPESYSGAIGNTVLYTTVATGEGLTYQWYAKAPGSDVWSKTALAGNTTATLSVKAIAARDGYAYRCVVTDQNGKTETSEEAEMAFASAVRITSQPVSYAGKLNGTASFRVTATGEGLKYQWYAKAPGSNVWNKTALSGNTTPTLTVKAIVARDGYAYHCVVKDSYGVSKTTEEVTLTLQSSIVITGQPASYAGSLNGQAAFRVNATGSGLRYQWYVKIPGSDVWKKTALSGNTTATLSVKAIVARNGYAFRCVISDSNGTSRTTDEVTLTIASSIVITAQPASYAGALNSPATFRATATGDGLTYQWYVKVPGSTVWNKTALAGNATATLSVKAIAARNGYAFRCVIGDRNGTTKTTDEVTLSIASSIAISAQPQSQKVDQNTTVNFTASATGDGLTYQWYAKAPGSSEWKVTALSGNTTSVLKVKAILERSGYSYRCVISDSNGTSKITEAAGLTVVKVPTYSTTQNLTYEGFVSTKRGGYLGVVQGVWVATKNCPNSWVATVAGSMSDLSAFSFDDEGTGLRNNITLFSCNGAVDFAGSADYYITGQTQAQNGSGYGATVEIVKLDYEMFRTEDGLTDLCAQEGIEACYVKITWQNGAVQHLIGLYADTDSKVADNYGSSKMILRDTALVFPNVWKLDGTFFSDVSDSGTSYNCSWSFRISSKQPAQEPEEEGYLTAQTWYSSSAEQRPNGKYHVLMLDDIVSEGKINALNAQFLGYVTHRTVASDVATSQYTSIFDYDSTLYRSMVRNMMYDYLYQGVVIALNNTEKVSSNAFCTALSKVVETVRSMQPGVPIFYLVMTNDGTTDYNAVKNLMQSLGCGFYDCTGSINDHSSEMSGILAAYTPKRTVAIQGSVSETEYKTGREELMFSIYDVQDYQKTKTLPRALLIGDSISYGYYNPVRTMMNGTCTVDEIAISLAAADCVAFCRNIDALLDEYTYDVIHFNVGIHTSQNDETNYAIGIAYIMDHIRAKQPNAKIIFATTTTIGANSRNTWVEQRNAAAVSLAAARNIAVDDLYQVCLTQNPPKADVYHFRDYTPLANQVCISLREALR